MTDMANKNQPEKPCQFREGTKLSNWEAKTNKMIVTIKGLMVASICLLKSIDNNRPTNLG